MRSLDLGGLAAIHDNGKEGVFYIDIIIIYMYIHVYKVVFPNYKLHF